MKFVQHPTNNLVLGAPPNWQHDELPCDALPITRVQASGHEAMLSFWKPSPEELEALNAGSYVMLSIFGNGHPPVALEVSA